MAKGAVKITEKQWPPGRFELEEPMEDLSLNYDLSPSSSSVDHSFLSEKDEPRKKRHASHSPEPEMSRKRAVSPQPGPSGTSKRAVSPQPGPSGTSKRAVSPQPGPSCTSKRAFSPQPVPSRTSKRAFSPQPGPSGMNKRADSPLPSTSDRKSYNCSQLLVELRSFLHSPRGGSHHTERAKQYHRIVECYFIFSETGDVHKPLNVEYVDEYLNANEGKGPAWHINVILFLTKFCNFLSLKRIVTHNEFVSFSDSLAGLRKSYGRESQRGEPCNTAGQVLLL